MSSKQKAGMARSWAASHGCETRRMLPRVPVNSPWFELEKILVCALLGPPRVLSSDHGRARKRARSSSPWRGKRNLAVSGGSAEGGYGIQAGTTIFKAD